MVGLEIFALEFDQEAYLYTDFGACPAVSIDLVL